MNTNADLVLHRLSQAAPIVQRITGERPHLASLHRWRQRGVGGVKLQTTYAMGCHRTTETWIQEFFANVTAAKAGEPVIAPEPKRCRQTAIDRAEKELSDAGI